MPNIWRSKINKAMKFGQLIEYNGRNIFLQKSCRKWGRETSSRPFKKLQIRGKQKVSIFILKYFGRPQLGHKIKANCVTFQTVDLEIRSILNFCKRVWNELPHQILCMIFQQKYSSCYTLLTDKILLSGCRYILKLALVFLKSHFLTLSEKSVKNI